MKKTTNELTTEEMETAGAMLADALRLRRDREHKDRWITRWGTKTNQGLYLTLREMVRRVENREAL